jgi:multidrug efflux pump subunit AcrA (membrane-fusion protein)
VQRVPVQVGSIREQQVEIISGLSRGEQVVSAGIYQLQPGQQVQPFVAY